MSTAITPGPVAAAWLDAQVVSTAIMRSAGALAWLDAQVVSTAITPGPVAAAWLDAQVVTGQLDLADIPLTYPPFRNQFAGRSSVDAVAGMGRLNCHNALGDRTALSPARGFARLTSQDAEPSVAAKVSVHSDMRTAPVNTRASSQRA